MKIKFKLRLYLLGLGLIGLGLGLLYFGFYGQTLGGQPWPHQPMLTTAAAMSPAVGPSTSSANTRLPKVNVPFPGTARPVNLTIPDAGINLAVAEGFYNHKTKTWTLTPDKAHFAIMTDQPNTEKGQTFIYGHNRQAVFGRLHQVQTTSLAFLTTSDKMRFTYRLRSIKTTIPADSSVFNYSGAPILTLQTCSGAAFQNRSFYIFDLIKAEHV